MPGSPPIITPGRYLKSYAIPHPWVGKDQRDAPDPRDTVAWRNRQPSLTSLFIRQVAEEHQRTLEDYILNGPRRLP